MSDLTGRLNAALSGRYRIERELGRGGMATVYLAEDLKHHRPVAIKVLDPELGASIGAERFLREIEIAAGLNHPQILPLHDSGTVQGLLYYVMPYVEGESLRQRLDRERQLPLDDVVRITREVADALEYAHGQGVVHRDIKPENILVSRGHAVVADFGIARAIRAAGAEKLTIKGAAIGTPLYMSPEQALGGSELDGRSDVYSLACVVYEMLAGQPPFTGPAESVVHQHMTVAPRPVSVLRLSTPAAAATTLARALEKVPADRFGTAAQFAEALTRGASEVVTAATPVVPASRRSWRLPLLAGAVVLAIGAVLLVLRPGRQARGPAGPVHLRSEIAVLPFQNLSVEGPQAYFAGGLHEELLTQLAKVAALKVISRTSVMGYQGTGKPLKTIATELGVGSVVEGSVQVVGGRLRVHVQLIDAATDQHLWSESYNRTLDDAFAIQSEVAQQIVAAVGATLTGAEQEGLTAGSTANAEAYRLYLQGREYWARPGYLPENWRAAQQLYERALALDPNFALAHAALSRVHGWMYWSTTDHSATRAARQREEAETALRLAPDLPEAHMAMGVAHYWGRRDYRRALDEYAIALERSPNDAELWEAIGSVHRRLGHWNEVFAAFEKAARLNPRFADLFADLGGQSYQFVHRYADAVRAYDRALILAPDLHDAATNRAWTYVAWKGQLDTLRAVLRRLPGTPEDYLSLLILERNPDSLLRVLRMMRTDLLENQSTYMPRSVFAAWAHEQRGDRVAARAALDSALLRLDSASKEFPGDWRVHSARGLTLAMLGRGGEALREAGWLRQSAVYRGDAHMGAWVAQDRAIILAQTGDAEAACDEIDRLLAGPSNLSVHLLRLDPMFDRIREQPRFKAVLAKYGG